MHLENVEVKKEAVWVENTILNFEHEGSTSSRVNTSLTEANTISVKAIRLFDGLTKQIDLLKIDIEGAEYDVIKDIEPKLFLIKNLFVEYHGKFSDNPKLEELQQLFTRNGFKYYIGEAHTVYETPFYRPTEKENLYDVQLNFSVLESDQDILLKLN